MSPVHTVTKKKNPKQAVKKSKEAVKRPKGHYFYAVGRRKRAVARVQLKVGSGQITINQREVKEYFPTFFTQKIIYDAQRCIGREDGFDLTVKVLGGGIQSQAEAVRHGISRALVLFEPNFRKKLKRAGFLKRDPRKKERKKYGLKRARRAPQWSKR